MLSCFSAANEILDLTSSNVSGSNPVHKNQRYNLVVEREEAVSGNHKRLRLVED